MDEGGGLRPGIILGSGLDCVKAIDRDARYKGFPRERKEGDAQALDIRSNDVRRDGRVD